MCLRKVCPHFVVQVKRSVCDRGHAFASKNRKPRRTAVGESENAMKHRKALLSEEELVRIERDKRVRELLKHFSRLYTGKNRTEHMWQAWEILKHLNRPYTGKNRTKQMASMRASETFQQTYTGNTRIEYIKEAKEPLKYPVNYQSPKPCKYDRHKHLSSSLRWGFCTSMLFIYGTF